jgi:PKD repeat protein
VTLVGVTVSAIVLSMLSMQPAVADTVPPVGTPETVSSDPLPAPQINGVVWDQYVIGNTVYVGGDFTTARPAGSAAGANTVTRNNFLAYNLTTGALLPFAPSFNAQVRAITASPDKSRLYVAGQFTTAAGATRYRVAAFDVASGSLITTFAPTINSRVNTVVATASTVFVGGQFTSAGGQDRSRTAAFSASNGAVTAWAPGVLDGNVAAMVISPSEDKVVFGGSFTQVNGSGNPGYGLAAVDTATGASQPWAINSLIRNGGAEAAINSLATDGTKVYGTGYHYGSGGNLEGTFSADWAGGELTWVEDCHGDSYSVSPGTDVIYTAGHAHYCGNVGGFPQTDPWTYSRAIAFTKATTRTLTSDPLGYYDFNGTPAPTLLDWFPTLNTGTFTGAGQGPWDVFVSGDYVLYGGEFTTVNGKAQQGLVRFATKTIAPNDDGPRLTGTNFVPSVASFSQGTARVAWQANHDRDNALLTYDVIRNNQTATPVYTTQMSSNFYTRPLMSFMDTGLVPGQTYTYRIRATDPYGNSTMGTQVSVTVSADGEISDYTQDVLDDNPTAFWPLGESSGTVGYDWTDGDDLTLSGDITRGTAGQEQGSSNTATTFAGNSSTFGVSTAAKPSSNSLTAEAWIKTSTTSGGKIIGFGNSRTGDSGSYDRHVYMDNSGRLTFGVYTGSSQTITSGSSYNDDQWHHVVATLGANGMQLYVDSKKVASRTDTTAGQPFNGYWRIGGDNLGGWPNGPQSNYFAGAIDDVAVYSSVLTRQQIDAHYVSSGRASTIPAAPADAYGAAVFGLDPTLYYRLGESDGTVATDSGPFGNPGTYTGLVNKGASGAVAGTSNTAAQFAPTEEWWGWNEAGVASATTFTNPTTYGLEAWFKTTTNRGGKIIGFGASPTGGSGGYDRHVYMENDGRLTFGTWTGQANTITSGSTYNDGQWHHLVAQQSSAGMKMFVDGASVGTNPQTGAQDYTGYWRIGGDTTWGGTAPYFAGTIDEVAVYSAPLTDEQVEQHHDLGLGVAANVPPTASFTSAVSDLEATFDASASTDSDGTIASTMWSFGDGTQGTGATISHSYSQAGTFTVTVTVTDNRGGTATSTKDVTVTAPNNVPTASFTATATNLSAAFDASASADSDGTIAGYAWNFGDGDSATGVTTTHAYDAAGDYLVTLTVTDDRGATASTTRIVSATVPANQNPTASFTAGASGLGIAVDGSASSDSDGTIASYAWDFGDATTGSGASTTHTYTQAGTYTVTLTVSDDDGATAQVQHDVTVTAPPATTTIAADGFERTTTSAWGSAQTGGPWTVSGGSSSFSVTDGKGSISLPAGGTRTARLNSTSVTDATITAQVSASAIATGSGVYATVIGRQVGTASYSARVWIQANGSVRIQLLQGGTALQAYTVPGLTYTAGSALAVKLEITGTSPTTLKAKVWAAGGTEPAAWQVQATDTTAALQSAGALGLGAYLPSSATNGPITVRFDDYLAAATGTTPPPANQAPTASFTATPSGLTAALDASASADADGSIASYAWQYGDGQTGTGRASSHPYAVGGTYTVTLTVTDDDGATNTTTRSVTVTAPNVPGDPAVIAADAFARTTTNGWGSAPTGGAWSIAGTASNFSTDGSSGLMTAAAGQTRTARLGGVSATDTDSTVTFTVPQAPTGGGQYVSVIGRQVGSDTYSARVWLQANGVLRLQLMHAGTAITAVNIPGITYTAGTAITVRTQVFGTSPTTIRAKAWVAGQAEPAAWQVSATDATAAMQAAGSVGLQAYVSGSVTNAPIQIRFRDYSVTAI